jgi:hypothetical protein
MPTATADLRQRAAGVSVLAAVQLLVLAAAVEVVQAVVFFAGGHASALVLAAGAAAAAGVALLHGSRGRARDAVLATGLAAAVAIGAPLLARTTYDVSWDGQTYHQLAIQRLVDGWNPFAAALPGGDGSNAYFANHYAKGAWLRAASVYLVGGDIEAGKGWTFVLGAASGLAALGALLRARAIRGWAAAAAAILCAVNPVVATQLLTNYVDGQLASVITAAAALAAAVALGGGRVAFAGIAACASLAPGLKFTGVAYAGLVSAGTVAVAWRWHRSAARPVLIACVAGLAAGTLLVGFNPYVTNWRSRGHPFFPLAGPEAIDIVTGQVGAGFLAHSRLARVALSILAESRNDMGADPTLKWPFAWAAGETVPFRWPDVRFGGFGPLFSGALVFSLAALLAALRSDRRAVALAAAVAAGLVATALVNPHAWWARYAPQVWLVPIVLALGASTRTGGRAALALAAATFLTTAVDAGLVGTNAVHRGRMRSVALKAQLASLAREPVPVAIRFRPPFGESHRLRLHDAGVRFVEADPLPCARPETLDSSATEYCRGGQPVLPGR